MEGEGAPDTGMFQLGAGKWLVAVRDCGGRGHSGQDPMAALLSSPPHQKPSANLTTRITPASGSLSTTCVPATTWISSSRVSLG